jgi:multicomponent Na+:H+ antiporter subunit D
VSSIHLPVIVAVLPLPAALLLPLLRRGWAVRAAGPISIAVLTGSVVAALFSLYTVTLDGSYRYTFGGWPASIGVEFAVTHLTALLALLVTGVSLLIVIYALRDAGSEIRSDLTGGYFTLILVTVFAMLGMVYTNDLFNLYVFMEMLSISSCAIVTIAGGRENLYAGLKYLIIGTVGSVTVLFGMAILYMISGNLNMSANGGMMPLLWIRHPLNIRIALGLMLTGFGIKAAVFPMHTWLPDAHSVAPAPSSALLSALVVKVYLVGALKVLFVVFGVDILRTTSITTMLIWIGLAAMISGSVLALGQQKVKRILAYSTVSHIGYIVLGFGLATPAGLAAAFFHIIAHALLKAGLFLSVGAVIHRTGKQHVGEYAGVGYRMPLTMLVFSISALGMIGIPGTNGFMSKWYLILAAAEAGRTIVLPFILLSSFLNALYYIPIITRSFIQRSTAEDHVMQRDILPLSTRGPLVAIAVLVMITGLLPGILMPMIRTAVTAMLEGL